MRSNEVLAGRDRRGLRRSGLLAGLLMLPAIPAMALEVKSCADAGLGIESIAGPVEKTHLSLYDGKVEAYTVDTVEPACCSSGVAIVVPAKDDPSGGSDCWAVVGLVSVDVRSAKRSYDQAKGLLLTMPARRSNQDGDAVDGPPLKLRINLGEASVSLE
jgi:hypothetical protein